MKCTAHRSDGRPCDAHAIRGAVVCRVHGGSAPQVRAAAARRLRALAPAALNAIEDALSSDDLRVALAAAREVLNRIGLESDGERYPYPGVEMIDGWINELEAELTP